MLRQRPEAEPKRGQPVPRAETFRASPNWNRNSKQPGRSCRARSTTWKSPSEEQKAINEEALSVQEEYQSTNEELLTSKEELQSLNEELTALNSQLQETLERQRTTSNDLQNVLYSTDVATLFLDSRLNIRFFTPATKALFNVMPGDIGRPLSDLNSLAADDDLLADARPCCGPLTPIEREIEAARRLVHPPHPAVSDPGQRGRRRCHHVRRHHRAAARGGCNGGCEAAGGAGQRREVALPRRGQP